MRWFGLLRWFCQLTEIKLSEYSMQSPLCWYFGESLFLRSSASISLEILLRIRIYDEMEIREIVFETDYNHRNLYSKSDNGPLHV